MTFKPVNPGNHPQKSLVDCNDISPLQESINIDQPTKYCADGPGIPNQTHVATPDEAILEDISTKKIGLGHHNQCDPMMTGQIIEDLENPSRDVVYQYDKSIRATNDAVMDLFRNVVVIDNNNKAFPVPIMWGTQERAVATILQDNIRKDNSNVVDRIRLPLMSIHSTSHQFNDERYIYHKAIDYMRYLRPDGKPGNTGKERYERDTIFGVARGIPLDISYTLHAWCGYIEDMEQIMTQILRKFSRVAYISVRGVSWETIVKLDDIGNDINYEPGEDYRIIKMRFNMTAETFLTQPVVRKKAVLKTTIDVFNSVEKEKITDVLMRLEDAIEEFDND